jgi:hypothetical protein
MPSLDRRFVYEHRTQAGQQPCAPVVVLRPTVCSQLDVRENHAALSALRTQPVPGQAADLIVATTTVLALASTRIRQKASKKTIQRKVAFRGG